MFFLGKRRYAQGGTRRHETDLKVSVPCAGTCPLPEQRSYQQGVGQTMVARAESDGSAVGHATANKGAHAQESETLPEPRSGTDCAPVSVRTAPPVYSCLFFLDFTQNEPKSVRKEAGGREVHDLSTRCLRERAMLMVRGETSRRARVPSGAGSSLRAIAWTRAGLAHTRHADGGVGMQLALGIGTRPHTRPPPPGGA
jgi:hypothetical protein